jgi:hypothetical protein
VLSGGVVVVYNINEFEMERLGRGMERMEQEMRRALDAVHRHYRRDLVLYRPPQAPAVRSDKKRN